MLSFERALGLRLSEKGGGGALWFGACVWRGDSSVSCQNLGGVLGGFKGLREGLRGLGGIGGLTPGGPASSMGAPEKPRGHQLQGFRSRFRVQGLGLGLRVQGLGARALSLGCRV